jgi:hypothetical protein
MEWPQAYVFSHDGMARDHAALQHSGVLPCLHEQGQAERYNKPLKIVLFAAGSHGHNYRGPLA